ncbi:site-specific integrase [Myxococcota bacterium]
MLEHYFDRPAVLRRHRDGLFGPYLDSFVSLARGLGYPRATVRQKCLVLRELGHYLTERGDGVKDLDEALIARFLADRCNRRIIRSIGGSTSRLLLGHLREIGLIAPPKPFAPLSQVERLLERYSGFLKTERGLSQATLDNYLPYAQRFLDERFQGGPIRVQEISPTDISRFVVRHIHACPHKRDKLMISALRSFFRFLLSRGEIECDLAAAVPTVAQWRYSTVPKRLSREETARMLEACDPSTVIGRRDRALLLLISRLGLRASEVIAFDLDDIDWRSGEIVVRGKGGVHDRLPLLHDVGDALATYLRDRPSCTCRQVFIRTRAPIRGFAHPSTVSTIVRRALERAGLHPPAKGAHLLRHSLATEMLSCGATMSEIGQVLRHRSPQTTEIYAKVDTVGLRALARPWPGEEVRDA